MDRVRCTRTNSDSFHSQIKVGGANKLNHEKYSEFVCFVMKRCRQIVHEKRKSQPEPQERKRVMLGPWRTLLRFGLCILHRLEAKASKVNGFASEGFK